MSGLEIAALSVLGASYFDAKHRIYNDLFAVRGLLSAELSWAIAQRRHRISLIYTLLHYAKTRPDHPFLLYCEPILVSSSEKQHPLRDQFRLVKYTYAEALELAQRYSHYLTVVHDVRPNDVVALDFVNKPEYVLLWFALWNIGAVPALINYNLRGRSLEHCVKVSNAKLLIVDEEIFDEELIKASRNLEAENGISTVLATSQHFEQVRHQYPPIDIIPTPQTGANPACYIFTSGTTGLPKAANFSWKKANYATMLYGNVSMYTKNDVLYSAMPLYHSTAAALGLMATLQKGGTYAIGHKFSTTTFWIQARLCNATAIQYVGETCRYLLNAPSRLTDKSHGVKIAHGNGMRPDIWAKFKDRFGINTVSEFYAATETPTALNNVQQGAFGLGACGSYGTLATFVLRHGKWNIAKIDHNTGELYRSPKTGFCVPAAPEEPGEFLFKLNPNRINDDFQGYAGNAKASNEKLVRNVFAKGDAFVRSGDLLKYDSNNNVYFVDRLGDTFRWKSENVSTNEVEQVIAELPNVEVVVVVGVKVPKHEGRAGFAVIKLKDEKKGLDMAHLGAYLLKRLPRYAVPIFVKFVGTMHQTGNNKIQKNVFRNQQIPAPEGETLYWLFNNEYRSLTPKDWARVEGGHHKL